MKIKLHYRTKEGKRKVFTNYMTVKQAKYIYKERFKNDNNIVYVFLTAWLGWHDYCYKTLKDTRKGVSND